MPVYSSTATRRGPMPSSGMLRSASHRAMWIPAAEDKAQADVLGSMTFRCGKAREQVRE